MIPFKTLKTLYIEILKRKYIPKFTETSHSWYLSYIWVNKIICICIPWYVRGIDFDLIVCGK